MANNNVYRHGDYPVAVTGSAGSGGSTGSAGSGYFLTRVQSIDLNKTVPTRPVYELGNFSPVGTTSDTAQYSASMTWFPTSMLMENLLKGGSGSTGSMSLKDIQDAVGQTLYTPKVQLGGSKVVGLEYSCQANAEFRGTVRIRASSWFDGVYTIAVATPAGTVNLRSKDCAITLNSVAGVRVAGFSVRADFNSTDLIQLGAADPVAIVYDSPSVSCDVDFYESDAIAGAAELSGSDIVITVGTAAAGKVLTLKNMKFTGRPVRGVVMGNATRRYSYIGGGDGTTYGMTIAQP